MRKTLRSVLLITFCACWVAVNSLAAQNAPETSAKGLATPGASVAILDLFNLSNNSEYDPWETLWGRGLRRALFANKQLKVIAYPHIHSALKELKVDDYFIAPEQVPPIGKKLGADFVVLGSFTISKNMIAASLKVVDGKTGRMLAEQTLFADATKPNEFIGDLSTTLLKILLGAGTPPSPAPPAVENPLPPNSPPPPAPETSTTPILEGAPIPSAPTVQSPPPAGPVLTTPAPEIVGPEEIEGAPVTAPPMASPPMSPAPGAIVQPPAVAPPQTMVRPIEAEIPSMPRTGAVPSQALQSPFAPMPVMPAPPPPVRPYTPPPQYQMPTQGMAPGPQPMGPRQGMATRPMQQPQPQPYVAPAPVEEPGRIRKFFSWVTRPFRPAENLPPPQVNPPAPVAPQPQMRPQPQVMPQPLPPQPAPTPAPQGNAVTRFFGRMFGRSAN